MTKKEIKFLTDKSLIELSIYFCKFEKPTNFERGTASDLFEEIMERKLQEEFGIEEKNWVRR